MLKKKGDEKKNTHCTALQDYFDTLDILLARLYWNGTLPNNCKTIEYLIDEENHKGLEWSKLIIHKNSNFI